MINASKGLVVAALAFVALSTIQGLKAHRILTEKALSQAEVTEGVHRWKENYLALGESVKRWEQDYRRQDSVQDLMSLYSIMNMTGYGLAINTDSLIVNKISPEMQNSMPIGLTKICLASGGSGDGSVEVQAQSYQDLFNGIKRLAERPDIYIGNISIKGDKLVASANLGEFCVLLSK